MPCPDRPPRAQGGSYRAASTSWASAPRRQRQAAEWRTQRCSTSCSLDMVPVFCRASATNATDGRANALRFAERTLLRGFRLLNQGFLADHHDDARFSNVEAAAVGFEVVADFGVLGQADVAVDDGATDFRVAADVHVVVDDAVRNVAVAV